MAVEPSAENQFASIELNQPEESSTPETSPNDPVSRDPVDEFYRAMARSASMRVATEDDGLMTVDMVQKVLGRSRASIYRYANTDPERPDVNLPHDPRRLNPEYRTNKDDVIKFHPNEVARFAREVLGIKNIIIETRLPPETRTDRMFQAILTELQQLRTLLEETRTSQ
jgi:hypothetical protein